MLIFDISPNYLSRNFIAYASNKIAAVPKLVFPKDLSQRRISLENFPCGNTFQNLHNLGWRIPRRSRKKEMHMIFHNLHGIYFKFILLGNLLKNPLTKRYSFLSKYFLSILRYPNQMILQIIYGMMSPSNCAHT